MCPGLQPLRHEQLGYSNIYTDKTKTSWSFVKFNFKQAEVTYSSVLKTIWDPIHFLFWQIGYFNFSACTEWAAFFRHVVITELISTPLSVSAQGYANTHIASKDASEKIWRSTEDVFSQKWHLSSLLSICSILFAQSSKHTLSALGISSSQTSPNFDKIVFRRILIRLVEGAKTPKWIENTSYKRQNRTLCYLALDFLRRTTANILTIILRVPLEAQ